MPARNELKCWIKSLARLCAKKNYRVPNFLRSNTLSYVLFAPQRFHKLLFLDASGRTAYSKQHLKAITYAKFGVGV